MDTMYVMSTATWPSYKTPEVTQKRQEADKKAPIDALGATIIAHIGMRIPSGVKTIVIVEPPEEKFADYLRHMSKRQFIFSEVEGYESAVDTCGDLRTP